MNEDPTPADSTAPEVPSVPPVSTYGTKGLEAWIEANRATFTEEALKGAATAAGWDPTIVETALGNVQTRETVAPLRARARRIVRYLYLAGFALLAVGMAINPAARSYGSNVIGVIVLFFALGVAYGLGSMWFNRKGVSRSMTNGDMFVLLSVPFVFWLVVTGLCVATGLPIPRAV